MSIKTNLKRSLFNLASAASATVRVSSELVLEVSSLAVSSVDQVIPAAKEVIKSPLTAYSGYLIEHDELTPEEAEKVAYALLDKDVATAIKAGSRSVGTLLAKASEGWDFEEEEVSTK